MTDSDRAKVLLLGNDDRVMLAVARSLGRRGVGVEVAWCPKESPACGSRYVQHWRHLPDYAPHDRAWLESLIALMRRQRYQLVLPVNDPAVVPLTQHRCELEPHGRIYLLGSRAYEVGFDKIRTAQLAESLGIPMPRSVQLTLPDDLEQVTQRLSPPVYLKPQSSVTTDDLQNKQSVIEVQTEAEFEEALQRLTGRRQVIVQEAFAGRGVGVEVLADRGEILVAFQHVRHHETIDGGSTYRESVPVDPALLDASRRLLESIDYTGVAMLEFRHDPETGRWTFLEINARFWGSLPLAVAAGADFPRYLYEFLVEGRRCFLPEPGRSGIRCRNLVKDIRWMKACWKEDRAVALREAARCLVQLATFRDRTDMFASDDLRPGILDLGMWLCGTARRETAKTPAVVGPPAPSV